MTTTDDVSREEFDALVARVEQFEVLGEMVRQQRDIIDAERKLADDLANVLNLVMTSPHDDKYEEVERVMARYREARA